MLPVDRTIEGIDIPPDIRVEVPQNSYSTADPTLEKGLAELRKQVAAAKK